MRSKPLAFGDAVVSVASLLLATSPSTAQNDPDMPDLLPLASSVLSMIDP